MQSIPTVDDLDVLIEEKRDSIQENPFRAQNNKLNSSDKRIHDWYRFVLSYPAHLVRNYLEEFCTNNQSIVLDPFCGTGTTLVEAKLNGFQSIGIEANPVAHFASSTKVMWNIQPQNLLDCAQNIVYVVDTILRNDNIDDSIESPELIKLDSLKSLSPELTKLILRDSISPLPLHKTLLLLEEIRKYKALDFYNHLLLALAKSTVFKASNLKFGPEVGLGKKKNDAQVLNSWLTEVKAIAADISFIGSHSAINSTVHLGDSRQTNKLILPNSIDAVITSPPYPNEKDYTRTTRLESVLLGFINSKEELRKFKKNTCSFKHTWGV